MSSLPSERRLLHVVVRPPWEGDALARALGACRRGDVLLLAQEAAVLACTTVALDAALARRLVAVDARVLAHDVAARGLAGVPLREGVSAIDDGAWVQLVVACEASVTWA